jgi:DNA-binding Lrp family transcriptional regulator
MDQIDCMILAELQGDGRLTVTELADRVQLTPAPCHRRLRELERAGVIIGYRAVLDPAAVGLGFEAIVSVTLERGDAATVAAFEAAIAAVPQIRHAERLFGDPDYLLRVVAADLNEYAALRDHELASLPGIMRITSTIVMKRIVDNRPLPLPGTGGRTRRSLATSGRAGRPVRAPARRRHAHRLWLRLRLRPAERRPLDRGNPHPRRRSRRIQPLCVSRQASPTAPVVADVPDRRQGPGHPGAPAGIDMVRHDAADRVGHRRLDPQPVPAEHGDRLAFGRQHPLPVIQADGVDADLRSLAEQTAEQLPDPGERSQPTRAVEHHHDRRTAPDALMTVANHPMPRADDREQFGDPGGDRLGVVAKLRDTAAARSRPAVRQPPDPLPAGPARIVRE